MEPVSHLKCLFSGMASWYINHTASEFEKREVLSGYWMGDKRPPGIPKGKYKRIWPYWLAHKLFQNLPFVDLEEKMRWVNLPLYDLWISLQTLSDEVNVVQAPMGSCEALFGLADKSGKKILKVYDSPNTHPVTQLGIWQSEADQFCPGYRVPVPRWIWERQIRELSQADLVLCPSLFVRETMVAHGVPLEKCFINRFGADGSIFKKRVTPPSKARFVTVGSVCVRKGHQYLFRAFEKVKKVLPEAELIVVGGVRPDFALEWPKWQGSFTYHERLSHPEIADLFQNCSAFVFPSLEEGFARVLSEAMAAGLPVIATHESGASTVVENGKEGFIVLPRDIDSLVEAMLSLGSNKDLNQKMSDSCWESGGEKNRWEDYSNRLLAEYSLRYLAKLTK